jgi:hypothetical protein
MAKIIENSALLMGQMMSQPLLISGLLEYYYLLFLVVVSLTEVQQTKSYTLRL